jgi:hypothetical protein
VRYKLILGLRYEILQQDRILQTRFSDDVRWKGH